MITTLFRDATIMHATQSQCRVVNIVAIEPVGRPEFTSKSLG